MCTIHVALNKIKCILIELGSCIEIYNLSELWIQ